MRIYEPQQQHEQESSGSVGAGYVDSLEGYNRESYSNRV